MSFLRIIRLTKAVQVKHIILLGGPHVKNRNQAQNEEHKFTQGIQTASWICKKNISAAISAWVNAGRNVSKEF